MHDGTDASATRILSRILPELVRDPERRLRKCMKLNQFHSVVDIQLSIRIEERLEEKNSHASPKILFLVHT